MRWRYLSVMPILLVFLAAFTCDFSFNKTGSEAWDTARPLKEIYKNDFLVGNIISPGDFNSADKIRFDIIKRHYNSVTAENDMKPEALAPAVEGEAYNRYANADAIVSAARAAGLSVHGHALVWHEQSPLWLRQGSRAEVQAKWENHISEVAGHFRGQVDSWDVVNEAMKESVSVAEADGDWKNCLRMVSPWNVAGSNAELIEKAFLAAREADPYAKLYYNDFNLDRAGKSRAVYKMVSDINVRYPGVLGRKLIDGIGMQSHHNLKTSPESIAAAIKLFASLGVEIAITEMDIMAVGAFGAPPVNYAWNDDTSALQARLYAAMFRVFRENAQYIKRVTFWGLDDGTSWRGGKRKNGPNAYPSLMDKDYGLKPAFDAVSRPARYR